MATSPGTIKFVTVTDFGAVGDGVTDCTSAIQLAVDTVSASGGGGVLVPAGIFLLSAVLYYSDNGSPVGLTSIKLLNGVHLAGTGPASILRLKAAAYTGNGVYYRMISSRDITALTNSRITDLTLDGNSSAQTISDQQCGNMFLTCASDVSVEHVSSLNSNGPAIQLVGTTSQAATNLAVRNCVVSSAAKIGIQCSQFSGLMISGNFVSDTTDNCIDIYGEAGSNISNGNHFSISGNVCTGGNTGIFVETSANGVVAGNEISSCTAGVAVNRITGQPAAINIVSNMIDNCPTGITITGDTGGVSVTGNHINDFSIVGVVMGGGSMGNVSYVDVSSNFLTPTSSTTKVISLAGTGTASFITGRFNTVNSDGITPAYLFSSAAGAVVNVRIDSFRVIPGQIGFDLYSASAGFGQVTLLSGTEDNVPGPINILLPTYSAGTVTITAYQSGIGRSAWTVPYLVDSSAVSIGSPQTLVLSADPISSVSTGASVLTVFLVAANTNVNWGIQCVPVSA